MAKDNYTRKTQLLRCEMVGGQVKLIYSGVPEEELVPVEPIEEASRGNGGDSPRRRRRRNED